MSLVVNPPQEVFVSNHFLDFYQHLWFCAYILKEYAAGGLKCITLCYSKVKNIYTKKSNKGNVTIDLVNGCFREVKWTTHVFDIFVQYLGW